MIAPSVYVALFWFSLGLVIYTFIGYGALIYLAGRLFPRPVHTTIPSSWPLVSVVVVMRNEGASVCSRLENLLASRYPSDRIEIIVVSDGSTDDTVGQMRALNNPKVNVIIQPCPLGKSEGVNAGVQAASGEIIIFADARQRFALDAIEKLVTHFSDPKVGAVSGALEIEPSSSNVGGGVDAYWRLEKWIRAAESRFDSCVGCTGAIYAIRRALFKPLPGDAILDDVINPMNIALQGLRVIHDSEAVAYDPQSLEPEKEARRKQRTLAGNYQMLFGNLEWLLPWRNRLWFQLISHKYLRLAAPWLLLTLFLSNAALFAHPFYRGIFAGQIAFYGLAGIGLILSSCKSRLISLPAGFVFLNIMALRGLWLYAHNDTQQGWGNKNARQE